MIPIIIIQEFATELLLDDHSNLKILTLKIHNSTPGEMIGEIEGELPFDILHFNPPYQNYISKQQRLLLEFHDKN